MFHHCIHLTGVLKHPRSAPCTKEALYQCKNGNKVKYTGSFVAFLLCARCGARFLLTEGEAGFLPWRGHVPSGTCSSFLSTHRRPSPGQVLFIYPSHPPSPTLWDQGDLPGPSALTAPPSQPPTYLMVADLSPLHLGGWHLHPSRALLARVLPLSFCPPDVCKPPAPPYPRCHPILALASFPPPLLSPIVPALNLPKVPPLNSFIHHSFIIILNIINTHSLNNI